MLGSSLGGPNQSSNNSFNGTVRAPPGIGFPQQSGNGAQSMYGMPSEGSNGASLMQPGQGQVQRGNSNSQLGQMTNGALPSMSMGSGLGNARSMGLGGSSNPSNAFGGYESLGPGSNGTDSKPFDMSDFPSLVKQGGMNSGLNDASGSGNQIPYAMHLAQRQQNTAFAIQKEDFPALPGGFGNAAGPGRSSMESKDNSLMHSSFAFRNDNTLQQQQQQHSAAEGSSQLFERRQHQILKPGRAMHRQDAGAFGPDSSIPEVLPRGVGGKITAATTNAVNNVKGASMQTHSKGSQDKSRATSYDPTNPNHKYGLLGLLGVIRMEDADRGTLALGTDLTTLGLNLNSSDALHTSFASPWADGPSTRDPPFQIPQCFLQPSKANGGKSAVNPSHFKNFQLESLFYMFYCLPRDVMQVLSAQELYKREWRYHMDFKLWFAKDKNSVGKQSSPVEYIYFDINTWERRIFSGTLPGRGVEAFMREELVLAAVNQSNSPSNQGATNVSS